MVLEPFMGSGTMVLAAERTGRRACGIEFEPRDVDVAIERWQRVTGRDAVLDLAVNRRSASERVGQRNRHSRSGTFNSSLPCRMSA